MKFLNLLLQILTFILLALPTWVVAQPVLRVVYSEKDAIKVGDEFSAFLFLENVTDEFAFASLTAWFYYDSTQMGLLNHSFEGSIIPDLGSPYFSENYNKKIAAKGSVANLAKVNIGFYRATKVVKNGLLVQLRMKALKDGFPAFNFSYAAIGEFEFKEVDGTILSDSLKIVDPMIKMISPEKQ
jgi:hypothetical protein